VLHEVLISSGEGGTEIYLSSKSPDSVAPADDA
jgi:hypothetical protein